MYIFAELCNHHCNLILGHFHHPLAVVHQIRNLYTFGPVFEDFGFWEVSLSSDPMRPRHFPGLFSSYCPLFWLHPTHLQFSVTLPMLSVPSFIPSKELKDGLFSMRIYNAHNFNVVSLTTFTHKSKVIQPCQGV